jgi:hypothetical protein
VFLPPQNFLDFYSISIYFPRVGNRFREFFKLENQTLNGAHLFVSLSPGIVLPLVVVGGFLLSGYKTHWSEAPVRTPPPPSPSKEPPCRPSPCRCATTLLSLGRSPPLTSSAFSPRRSSCHTGDPWSRSWDHHRNPCASPSNPRAQPERLLFLCQSSAHRATLRRHRRVARVTLSSPHQLLRRRVESRRLAPPSSWEHTASARQGK